jgi:BirA family biotin operon repressor/biotin-[acetyl-CoA-carboxylase] ligase
VVVAETVREETGAPLTIKWPNDLMLAKQKVGGILVEMAAEIGRINYLVIGIGLNANFKTEILPADLQAKTTTLATYLGHEVNRPKLIAALAVRLKNDWPQVEHNFAETLQRWRRLAATLNRRIKLKAEAKTFTGQALDVDNYGALVVKLDNGEVKHFQAGEVTVVK